MSRFTRALHGAGSGYFLLAVSTLCSLVSIRLALDFLSKESFALWAVMAAITGYLTLIDLGMSSSVARLLIDHKDDRTSDRYGGLVLTGWMVLLSQGAILLLLCLLMGGLFSELPSIPPPLKADFAALMRWQGLVLALGFGTRIFSHVLYAHQRLDVVNYTSAVSLLLNLGLMWVFFKAGSGILSMIWAGLLSAILAALAQWFYCWRLRLLPSRHHWGRPNWIAFKNLFSYGKDLFLVALGTQLVLTSQTLIITARVGLEAATLWAVGTKAYNIIIQLAWRIYDSASPGFAEMLARGEVAAGLRRFRTVVEVTASFACFCSVGYAMCNSSFVSVWMSGKLQWSSWVDLALGGWMVVMSLVHCHNGFVILTKKLGPMPYVYLLEGLAFVGLATVVAKAGGILGVVLCSVICSLLFSYAYGAWAMASRFGVRLVDSNLTWLRPAWSFLWRFLPIAILTYWSTTALPALARLGLHLLVCGLVGGMLLIRYGLDDNFKVELLRRMPPRVGTVLKPLLAPLRTARSTTT